MEESAFEAFEGKQMSLGLDEVTARLDSLKFNAQEKGQLKAQLMKLNSEQLLFLFDDDDVVTATLACMLKGRFFVLT